VHFLWTRVTGRFFFDLCARNSRAFARVDAFSRVASLDRERAARTIPSAPDQRSDAHRHLIVNHVVHRFQESIGGHPYLIEVAAVDDDRWRAYIVRIPGVPTALMPFYGSTPDQAAALLRQWLTRAHERAAVRSS
jgi:hypothetical protein